MTPEERAKEAVYGTSDDCGQECLYVDGPCKHDVARVADAIRAAVAEEREACAQIAGRGPDSLVEENDGSTYARNVAAEIRARA